MHSHRGRSRANRPGSRSPSRLGNSIQNIRPALRASSLRASSQTSAVTSSREKNEEGQELLATRIDAIYAELRRRGRVPLSELARQYQVSQQQIESWFSILAQQSMLTLHYPVFRKAYARVESSLIPKEAPEEKTSRTSKKSALAKAEEIRRRRRILLELLLIVTLLLFAVLYFRITVPLVL